MSGCDAELCDYWTGFGCACAAFDIDRPELTDCADCGCCIEDHAPDFLGGGCSNCGINCEGYSCP